MTLTQSMQDKLVPENIVISALTRSATLGLLRSCPIRDVGAKLTKGDDSFFKIKAL